MLLATFPGLNLAQKGLGICIFIVVVLINVTFFIIMIGKKLKKKLLLLRLCFTWMNFGHVKFRVSEIDALIFKITFINVPSKGLQFRNETVFLQQNCQPLFSLPFNVIFTISLLYIHKCLNFFNFQVIFSQCRSIWNLKLFQTYDPLETWQVCFANQFPIFNWNASFQLLT